MSTGIVKCPKCGTLFEVDLNEEAVACKNCNKSFITQKAIVQTNKSQSDEPLPANEYLKAARNCVDNALYEEALRYYTLASKKESNNWEITFYISFLEYVTFFEKRNINSDYKDIDETLRFKINGITNAAELVAQLIPKGNNEEVVRILNEIYDRLYSYFYKRREQCTRYVYRDTFSTKRYFASIYYFVMTHLSSFVFLKWEEVIRNTFSNEKFLNEIKIRFIKTGMDILIENYSDKRIDYYESHNLTYEYNDWANEATYNFKLGIEKLKELGYNYPVKKLNTKMDNFFSIKKLAIYSLVLLFCVSYFTYSVYTKQMSFWVMASELVGIVMLFKVVSLGLKYRKRVRWERYK